MFRDSAVRTVSVVMAAFALQLAAASPARAQAFVPAQGEGSVAIVAQDQFFRYHAIPIAKDDVGPIFVRSLLADVTYGLTDKVAITVGLPLVMTRYSGSKPHKLADDVTINPLDDGTWHVSAQDIRLDVRYNVTRNLGRKGIVFTPFVSSITPSHDYAYYVHAGFGRRLNEVQVGASAAKLFEHVIPGLVVQGRYAYGFVERIVDVSHNRSMVSLEAAYFVTPKLRAMGLSSGQLTHGGIDFYGAPSKQLLTPIEYVHHDQIQRENQLLLGAGASYSISDSLDIFGSWMKSVAQRNGHILSRGITFGASVSFTTPHARKARTDLAENSLARCVCEKGTK